MPTLVGSATATVTVTGDLPELDAADNTEIDELMTLVDELADHLRFKRLTDYPNAAWLKTEQTVLYAPEHMAELRQFTSIVTFTYRVLR